MRQGDVVGLIAPGSSVSPGAIDLSVKAIEKMGFNVVLGKACVGSDLDIEGIRFNDEARALDIMEMFLDESVSGVLALRGGYGSGRVLDLLDYGIIRRNKKPLFGYSDITALHIALAQGAGSQTYHMPMPVTEFNGGVDGFTMDYLMRCLCEVKPFGVIENPPGKPMRTLVGGKCEGVLVGGNLAVITSLLGTPYEINTKGRVLFLEDVDEPLYKIDRMLLQLRMAGKFRDCAGVIFGSFTNNGEEISDGLLAGVFNGLCKNKPLIYGLACGHCLPTVSLPFGKLVFVDADKQIIHVVE